MNFPRFSRSAQGWVLLGLLLLHLYPGGLTLCVKADGTRTVEFSCGCDHSAPAAVSCSCCREASASAQCPMIAAADDCAGCADFEVGMRQAPPTQLPAAAALAAVVPALLPLPAPVHVPAICPSRQNLPPPPLLAELQQPTVVIRV